jgi:putative transposase
MTRLRRIEDRDRFFFITTNLSRSQRMWDPSERDNILNCVNALRDSGAFWLFAYVVMPDHVHVLIRPNHRNLVEAMREFKIDAVKLILRDRGARGPLWQRQYFDRIIRRVRDFWEKVEYIHNNPVAAGLVARADDWHWSSYLAYTKGAGPPPIPVDEINLPVDGGTLLWPAKWRR